MSAEQAHIRSDTLPAPLLGPCLSLNPEYAGSPDPPSAEHSISSSQIGESSLGPSPRIPIQKHYWTKEEVSSNIFRYNTLI